MRLLLDTHTLLWWQTDPQRLSQRALQELKRADNEIFMSVVNPWEIQIKAQLGKLTLPKKLSDLIQRQQEENGFGLLLVHPEHVYELDALPFHHRDPFDRLLIAQSRKEGMALVSDDPEMKLYEVNLIW